MKRTTAETIAELRSHGYRVEVEHYRDPIPIRSRVPGSEWRVWHRHDPFPVMPRGGATRVTIVKRDDDVIEEQYLGESHCSAKDNYNRKIGVAIALGRALKNMPDWDTREEGEAA